MKELVTDDLIESQRMLYKGYKKLATKRDRMVYLWGKYLFNFSQIGEYFGVSRQYVQRVVREETGYREYDKPVAKSNDKCKHSIKQITYK